MHKCACDEHIKHISIFEQINETQIRCVYDGLCDIGILCSQNIWAFICVFDWNRLPTAELDRHYLRSGRENPNMMMNL